MIKNNINIFNTNALLPIFLLLFLYFIGGINKINNIKSVANSLKSKTNIPLPISLYKFIIVLVIILEIFGPIIIINSVIFNKYKDFAKITILCLIIFTIFATLIYHPPIGKEFNIFLKNVSIVGGLILLNNNLISN